MTADSQFALLNAVVDALRADSAIQGHVSTGSPTAARVYSETPQEVKYPHITVSPGTGLEFDTKTTDGMEATVMVHVWSQYRGDKEVLQIMGAVVDTLDQASLSLTGHTLVLLRFDFSEVLRDPDGVTRHGVQRFRALTQAV